MTGNLYEVEGADVGSSQALYYSKHLARGHAAGRWHASSRRKAGIEHVDVERQIDPVRAVRGDRNCFLRNGIRPHFPDFLQRQKRDPLLQAIGELGARVHPTGWCQ